MVAMVMGIERLRVAGDLLRHDGTGPLDRDAVLAATTTVWSAVADGLDGWPWQLQVRSIPIQFRLVRFGSPAVTVRRMAEAELRDFRQELLAFVEIAERLDGPERDGKDRRNGEDGKDGTAA